MKTAASSGQRAASRAAGVTHGVVQPWMEHLPQQPAVALAAAGAHGSAPAAASRRGAWRSSPPRLAPPLSLQLLQPGAIIDPRGTDKHSPVRLAYQPSDSSTFLSQQTSHQPTVLFSQNKPALATGTLPSFAPAHHQDPARLRIRQLSPRRPELSTITGTNWRSPPILHGGGAPAPTDLARWWGST
jgi:hypothetical protein